MSDSLGNQLHAAAWEGRVSDVSSLLKDINVNFSNQDQWTALHAASTKGQVEVVKLLLAHPNIDINVQNDQEETPFL